jgi:hypothetical protein
MSICGFLSEFWLPAFVESQSMGKEHNMLAKTARGQSREADTATQRIAAERVS